MTTSLEECRKMAPGYGMVPVVKRVPAGGHTVEDLAEMARSLSKQVYVMDHTVDTGKEIRWERYAVIGFAPALEFSCTDGVMTVAQGGTRISYPCKDPSRVLAGVLAAHKAPYAAGMPPFTGGLAGYFAYEYIKYAEPEIQWEEANPEQFKDMDLFFFDRLFVLDRQQQEILLIVNIATDHLEENYRKALFTLGEMENMLEEAPRDGVPPFAITGSFQPMFQLQDYIRMVEQARKDIRKGETCQIVLSNAVTAPAQGSLLSAYRVLRKKDPTRYMCYFSSDDAECVIASPEATITLQQGQLYMNPLAGTAARGKTKEEDLKNERELLADQKSLDEHNMLVDDARNEFGAVCDFDSIGIRDYLKVVRCARVMHIGTTVTGRLRSDKTALDVIDMTVPAGVVSGSPKIHGCELINAIEKNRRGIYGSTLGQISLTGDADFCVFIHSAFLKNGKVTVRSGGGIVIDSVPEEEHQECLNKAMAMEGALYEASALDKGGAEK